MGSLTEVVSVSIGSSARDHRVELSLSGRRFDIRREGTDGDMDRAVARLAELDGTVAAFGLGGIDISLIAAGREYRFRDGERFAAAVRQTPILDGTGLKGAIEADVVRLLTEDLGLELSGKKVLVTSAVDRWGMTEGFYGAGCEVVAGDLLYALKMPVMLRSRRTTERAVRMLAPAAVRLPYAWLYEADADHTTRVRSDSPHVRYSAEADIIAGDYKYVRKYLPTDAGGKWVITNTTTEQDVEFLRQRGVELLVTSTPRFGGRSFGTNVIEATLVALEGARGGLPAARYRELMHEVGFAPDVLWLQR